MFVYQCDDCLFIERGGVDAYVWFPTFSFVSVCMHHIIALFLPWIV